MARDQGDMARRPERVVIVDAEDPMTEIHGQFVWLEEHERVLAEVRRAAYAEGYDAGVSAGRADLRIVARRRRSPMERARLGVLAVLVLVALLMLPVLIP